MVLTRRKESGERNSKTREKFKGIVPHDWCKYPQNIPNNSYAGRKKLK